MKFEFDPNQLLSTDILLRKFSQKVRHRGCDQLTLKNPRSKPVYIYGSITIHKDIVRWASYKVCSSMVQMVILLINIQSQSGFRYTFNKGKTCCELLSSCQKTKCEVIRSQESLSHTHKSACDKRARMINVKIYQMTIQNSYKQSKL